MKKKELPNHLEIEYLLFKQINKPKNMSFIKIINVYDSKYRINIYCETQEDSLFKLKICDSFFCNYSSGKLSILN